LINYIKIDVNLKARAISSSTTAENGMRHNSDTDRQAVEVAHDSRQLAPSITRMAWRELGGAEDALRSAGFTGHGDMASAYPVTDFAAATIATAALALVELASLSGCETASVTVDRRLASIWFWASIRPLGWSIPAPWDAIAGDYRTRDGWIKLHTNAPRHRAAVERVLGAHADRDGVSRAVATWEKGALEAAIVDAGGCAAEMRTPAEWAAHPQGRAVAREPLVHRIAAPAVSSPDWLPSLSRPLNGLRVLDLTRILAGPVATRFLAAFGADVLRIDPPNWEEPSLAPEVTLGKRCTRLDLHQPKDRETFATLLSQADILVHGYRPGALDALGFDPSTRRSLSPGLIDVSLDAYGWSGPWAQRRGFDSLVQMSTGIADAGMRWRNASIPLSLPVQALDHGTGYLMAAAALRGLSERLVNGTATAARLSLARTAKFLMEAGTIQAGSTLAPETAQDLTQEIENTDWGQARRVITPLAIADVPMRWDRPASRLGSAQPDWLDAV
jgi:hypothetical protein